MDKNSGYYHDNTLYYQENDLNYDSDELDYSGGMRRKQKLRPTLGPHTKRAHYSLKVEYPTQPGYGVNRGPQAAKGGYISRTKVILGFIFVYIITWVARITSKAKVWKIEIELGFYKMK